MQVCITHFKYVIRLQGLDYRINIINLIYEWSRFECASQETQKQIVARSPR